MDKRLTDKIVRYFATQPYLVKTLYMKRILVLIVSMNSLCGCLNEKDYTESAIDPSRIIGEWICRIEESGEHKYVFHEDSTCIYEYTILNELLWGEMETTEYDYSITEGVLTLNPKSGYAQRNYRIVKLNESVMKWEWQQVAPNSSANILTTYNISFKRVN